MSVSSNALRTAKVAAAAAALAVAALTAGCEAGEGTKAGKARTAVVLRMADISSGAGYEPAVAYFVDRVGELSRGRLQIEVAHDWGNAAPGAEQQVVRDVARGRADLGWVGTRVFDTLGLLNFRALTAPMLIDSYALERVVIGSEIPVRMLPSLARLGVTGLAVLGDGLRKPVAVERPLLGPADWRGLVFATFRSRAQAAAIRELGASPVESWGPSLDEGLYRDEIQGFEKNLLVYRRNAMEREAPYVTANFDLWPQTVALLANPARLRGLTSEQRRWIRRAARDAAARSTDYFDRDEQLVRGLCVAGARFAYASRSQLAAARRAFVPVYVALERDPQTRTFVSRIERLKRSTGAGAPLAIPAGCVATTHATHRASAARPGAAAIPNGVYRVAWTEEELVEAGLRPEYAHGNHGVITLTLQDGRYRIQFAGQPDAICRGLYTVAGRTFTIDFYVPTCEGGEGAVVARWSVLARGDLRFHVSKATDAGDEVVWGAKPWKKIG